MAATLRDAYVQAVLRGWKTPALAADYVPGVAITTAALPHHYRPNGVHVDVPDHLVDRVSAYYIGASIINHDRPFTIITEA